MTTELTTTDLLPALSGRSKKELIAYAAEMVAEADENGDDLLRIAAIAAKMKLFAAELENAAKLAGVNDLARYDRNTTHKEGVKLSLRNYGSQKDYTADPVWIELNEAQERAHNDLVAWEATPQTLPKEGLLLSRPADGIMYQAYPPVRSAGYEAMTATIL